MQISYPVRIDEFIKLFEETGFPRKLKHPIDLKKNESYSLSQCKLLSDEGVRGDFLRSTLDAKMPFHGAVTFLSVVKLDDDFLEVTFSD